MTQKQLSSQSGNKMNVNRKFIADTQLFLPNIVDENGMESALDFIRHSPAGRKIDIFTVAVKKSLIDNNIKALSNQLGKVVRVFTLMSIETVEEEENYGYNLSAPVCSIT